VDFNRSESFLNVKKSDREIQKYDRNIWQKIKIYFGINFDNV
jgi:hypothetical protein